MSMATLIANIVASTVEDGIFVLSNDAGSFTSESISTFTADEIELADMNGDGAPEIAAQRPGDNLMVGSLVVLTNDGGGGFTSDAYALPQHVTGMGLGDVTGDSLGDVVVAFEDLPAVGAVAVFEQEEDGTFANSGNAN